MAPRFADDRDDETDDHHSVRDFLAGLFVFVALVLLAVAPSWDRTYGSSATAPTPTRPAATTATTVASANPAATPISRSFDPSQAITSGPGFAVCGASDTWMRPTVQDQNAHASADPRYRTLRFDDDSLSARGFRASAAMYDGAGNSSRTWLVMGTGLWSDLRISGTGCQTKEQQVWLFGYTPDRYEVVDGATASLTVHEQRGYRMVVITGEPRHSLVVFDDQRGMKLDLLTMMVGADPKQPLPATFPQATRPLDLILYPSCQIVSSSRHTDERGSTWYVQCGAGKVNVAMPGEALRQGWIFIGGDRPDGMQIFQKGALWMQIFYRRDGPGIEDPFGILQTYVPIALSPAPRPTP